MNNFLPENEGIDHINVYSKSQLELGRQLTNFAHTPFTCLDGGFESVEGYWYYLVTGSSEPRFKSLFGFKAKAEGKQLIASLGNDEDRWIKSSPVFISKIKAALWFKILQNVEIAAGLANSKLPLTHYYWYGKNIDKPDNIVYLPQYQWIIDELELIRQKLQFKN